MKEWKGTFQIVDYWPQKWWELLSLLAMLWAEFLLSHLMIDGMVFCWYPMRHLSANFLRSLYWIHTLLNVKRLLYCDKQRQPLHGWWTIILLSNHSWSKSRRTSLFSKKTFFFVSWQSGKTGKIQPVPRESTLWITTVFTEGKSKKQRLITLSLTAVNESLQNFFSPTEPNVFYRESILNTSLDTKCSQGTDLAVKGCGFLEVQKKQRLLPTPSLLVSV